MVSARMKARKAKRAAKKAARRASRTTNVKNIGSLSDIARKRVAATRPAAKAAEKKAATPKKDPSKLTPEQRARIGNITGEMQATAKAGASAVGEGFQQIGKAGKQIGSEIAQVGALGAVSVAGGALAPAAKGLGKAGALGAAKQKEVLTNNFWKAMNAAKSSRIGAKALEGVGRMAVNPVTKRLQAGIIGKIIGFTKSNSWITLSVAGLYGLGEWGLGDAREGMNYIGQKVRETENPDLIREHMELSKEIHTTTALEGLMRVFPLTNPVHGLKERMRALRFQAKVNNMIAEDKLAQLEQGITDEEIYEQRRIANEESKAKIQADSIIQLKEYKLWAIEADNADMKEDARFFRSERRSAATKALEDQKAIMELWMAYLRAKQQAWENSRPSKLNFGIV